MPQDIDITQDLTDGSDGGLGDVLPVGGNPTPNGTNDQDTNAPSGTVRPDQVTNTEPRKDEFSLRDQLSSAFKGETGKDGAQGADGQPDDGTASGAPSKYEGPALTKDSNGKWRTPDGMFASNEQVAAFEAAQQNSEAGADTTQTGQFDPTKWGMTSLEQEQFKALPAETQQFVGRTMEALNTRAAQYAEYDQIEQLIGPRRQAWGANGTNPVVALNQLFALSDFASTQPKDFIMWFAEQNNVDLDAALDERDQLQQVDPAVRELQGQVKQLSSMLNTQQGGTQQQQHDAYVNEVRNFASEKDEAGQLRRPYLTEVQSEWIQHITAVRQANPTMPANEVLQKAYDNACWSTPAVRERMQREAETKRRAEAARKAQGAKEAGSSITGAPAGGGARQTETNSQLSLRQELERQFAEARA